MSVLEKITAYKRAEVATTKAKQPLGDVLRAAKAAPPPRNFCAALKAAGAAKRPALIGEIKKGSPSRGTIREDFDPEALARAYERGGATCLSVLTDGPSFQGSSDHLISARAAVLLPVLRKDFMLDPYQVVQSRAMGADCILVILAMVDDRSATSLITAARDWGMDAIVEVHDEAETRRAVELNVEIIGINNRDLKTFVTTLDTTVRLKALIPPGPIVISESGLSTPFDLQRMASVGIGAYLIGEALMRHQDVEAATRAIISDWRR
jgi:indole-3-glycerol phosphate synthase